jgi:hypothetical protein
LKRLGNVKRVCTFATALNDKRLLRGSKIERKGKKVFLKKACKNKKDD